MCRYLSTGKVTKISVANIDVGCNGSSKLRFRSLSVAGERGAIERQPRKVCCLLFLIAFLRELTVLELTISAVKIRSGVSPRTKQLREVVTCGVEGVEGDC